MTNEDASAPREGENRFRTWLDTLRDDVIQTEYGYEPGEFDVFPEHWEPMFREGLTPSQAFRRALDAFAAARAS